MVNEFRTRLGIFWGGESWALNKKGGVVLKGHKLRNDIIAILDFSCSHYLRDA